MRFMTENGRFGVIIWPDEAYDRRFFGFQLVIADEVFGNTDPSIVWSAVHRLNSLPELTDPRVLRAEDEPDKALDAVLTDDDCNAALYQGAESLDGCVVAAYCCAQSVVWLAQRVAPTGPRSGPVATGVVAVADYRAVVLRVGDYYRRQQAAR